ncbi:MAG: hypothetical protein GY749_41360 [Desulfobacteraceae bacterium]|nr:hypothetical protein [Desulfobacteraceae bacterium]
MPARDKYHDEVKNALIKDGWTITHDPYVINYEEITVYGDLGAERLVAAERSNRKIVVEIKSFIKRSPIQDLKETLGQYDLYAGYLEVTDPERQIYIAIRLDTYETVFRQKAVQFIVQRYDLPLVIVDIKKEEIVTWTK